jgi:O-antigen/teichoic acid export membrane protein
MGTIRSQDLPRPDEADASGAPASIAQNVKVKALSEVAVRGSRLVFLIVAARAWGPERFGVFSFAEAVAAIVATGADFGLQLHLARTIARGGGRAMLAAAARAKLLLSAVCLAALAAFSLLYPREDLRWILMLAGSVLLAQSWCDFWNHYFRGRQSLRDEAIVNLTYVLGGSALACLALWRGAQITVVYIVLLLAALAGNVLAWRRVRALLPGGGSDAESRSGEGAEEGPSARGAPSPSHTLAARALRDAFPIGVATLLSTIYFRLDMVLLQWLRGDAETGAYGAAYRLFESALVLPALILAALFPVFAERSLAPRADLTSSFRGAFFRMTALGIAVAVALALVGPPLLRLIYGGAYAESAALLRWLAPTLCFLFPNYVLAHFLVATGEQRSNAWMAAFGVPVNVAVNLALIPAYGARGAVVATLATEVALFVCGWLVAERRIARQPVVGSMVRV